MFTGLIEELGEVRAIDFQGECFSMTIGAEKIMQGMSVGDSISTNGVCLTVTEFGDSEFRVDVMPETFRRTSLGELKISDKVNLERAMAANKRFGGHIVSGHIDGVGFVKNIKRDNNAVVYEISAGKEILDYIVFKGSVALDGTSLTVFEVCDDSFKVSVIPHTLEETILPLKDTGSKINIECDVIGKYIEKSLKRLFLDEKSEDINGNSKSKIDEDFLRDNGFI